MSDSTKAVALRPDLTPAEVPTVAQMMWHLVQTGITSENVAVMKELAALQRDMDQTKAERDFNIAFIAMMKEIPKVQATRAVMAKDGSVKYKIAPFEEIDAAVRPICQQFGFSYSFLEGVAAQPGRICKVCHLMHVGGHSRDNPYSVRIGQGPPGASESQADGSAHSYAKRGALCDALGVVIGHSDADASQEGAPVTPEQADEIERRVKMTNSNVTAFLKWAGATSFATIPANRYDEINQNLIKKEQRH